MGEECRKVEVEVTELVLLVGSKKYVRGQKISLSVEDAEEYIDLGWVKCVTTGRQGERNPSTVTIKPNNIIMTQEELDDYEEGLKKDFVRRAEKCKKEFSELDQVKDEAARNYRRASILMITVQLFAQNKEPLPDWTIQPLTESIDRFFFSDATTSLDRAFNLTPESEYQAKKYWRDKNLEKRVANIVGSFKEAGVTIPWDDIAKEVGASKTAIQALYYSASNPP